MREKLNENPRAQVALVGLLIVAVGFLLVTRMGGGDESSAPTTEVAATVNGVTGTGSTPGEAVEGAVENLEARAETATTSAAVLPASMPVDPLPHRISVAYKSGKTVVLLFVRDGGIDDRIVDRATKALDSLSGVYLHVVPAQQIAQYASVTVGIGLSRVPALVVLRPRRVSKGRMEASVDYGYQTPKTVVQAVRDARYQGPESTYHPE
jgi:hypothetical protein